MGISATVHGNKILFIEIQGVSHTNPKYSGLLNLKCTENVRSQFVVLFDYPAAFSAYENAVFGDEYSSCLPLNEKQVISVREKSLSGCYRRKSHGAPICSTSKISLR